MTTGESGSADDSHTVNDLFVSVENDFVLDNLQNLSNHSRFLRNSFAIHPLRQAACQMWRDNS
jgi:hypothetical protein